MAKQTANWTKAIDAANRVAELGFPIDVLTPTVEVWTAGKNSGTEFHAENYAGTIAYHEAIKTLRQEGVRYGLEKLRRKGVELRVQEDAHRGCHRAGRSPDRRHGEPAHQTEHQVSTRPDVVLCP